jgi:hypothetical protein
MCGQSHTVSVIHQTKITPTKVNKTPPPRVTEVNKITAATVTEVNKINITNKTSISISNTHTVVPS